MNKYKWPDGASIPLSVLELFNSPEHMMKVQKSMIGELLELIEELISDEMSAVFVQLWDGSILCRFCFNEEDAHSEYCPYIKAKAILERHKPCNELSS